MQMPAGPREHLAGGQLEEQGGYGTVVVVAAFDAVRWTAEVAAAEAEARAALPPDTAAPELWLAAPPSPRAAEALAARGWRVHVEGEPRDIPP